MVHQSAVCIASSLESDCWFILLASISSVFFYFTSLAYSSPHLARSHYCQQLTLCLSLCLSVCLSRSFKLLLFCFSMESSHFFGRQFSMWHSTKRVFFDFWFRPPNAQNLLHKICTKSPISWLVWQIDRSCLGLPGCFRGWPIQWNHVKCCGADPCCRGNEILANLGYFAQNRLYVGLYGR